MTLGQQPTWEESVHHAILSWLLLGEHSALAFAAAAEGETGEKGGESLL